MCCCMWVSLNMDLDSISFFVLGKLKNEIQRLLYLVLCIFQNKIKESERIARKKSLNN